MRYLSEGVDKINSQISFEVDQSVSNFKTMQRAMKTFLNETNLRTNQTLALQTSLQEIVIEPPKFIMEPPTGGNKGNLHEKSVSSAAKDQQSA